MNEFKLNREYNWQLAHDPIQRTGYYEFDYSSAPPVINVNTLKGIIEITNISTTLYPTPSFGSSIPVYINNPDLNLTEDNRDNVYIQYSLYYKSSGDDNAIPYAISTGFLPLNGIGLSIYNASPAVAGADQWEGKFYIYYELYTR